MCCLLRRCFLGIAGGVTDLFYEPYQGIIQGPGEFFEGLGLGALSLLGHTVGQCCHHFLIKFIFTTLNII